MLGPGGTPIPVTQWSLRYEGYTPREEGLREALCTTGNGYFATRGAAPESAADGTHYPGTYIAGCYNELRTEVAGRAVEHESLVNAPNWLPLTFAAEDEPWLDLDQVKVLGHHYYLARTSNGSTLSTLVHASVLARAHRERAVELFIDALRSDVADVQGGTTAEGIHLAAMAGTLDVLQRCFAGLELRGDILWLNPFWPKRLGTLEFTILYRDHMITLSIADHTVRLSSSPGTAPTVRVSCRGELRDLDPGQTLQFSL